MPGSEHKRSTGRRVKVGVYKTTTLWCYAFQRDGQHRFRLYCVEENACQIRGDLMPDQGAERLSFDDLKLHLIAFEVRFDPSYLMWDRSGAIWNEVVKFLPELKTKQAEPNRTVFE